MGGGDLNLKKSWHPSTLRNIERVWKAEQKHEAEQQKIEQLQKELAEERAREEIQTFAEDQGVVKKKEEKLDWMYQGPAAMVNRDEFLLGKKIDKTFETMQLMETGKAPETEETDVASSVFSSQNLSGTATVDLANKIREDPLFNIMKKEKEQRKNLLTNPVKMKQLQQMLKASISDKTKKKNKKSKKKKKHHESDSDDEVPQKKRKQKKYEASDSEEEQVLRKEYKTASKTKELSPNYHELNYDDSRKRDRIHSSGSSHNRKEMEDRFRQDSYKSYKNSYHSSRKNDYEEDYTKRTKDYSKQNSSSRQNYERDSSRREQSLPERRKDSSSQRYSNHKYNGSSRRNERYADQSDEEKGELDSSEADRLLREMQENAKWREKQRKRNTDRYKEEDERENNVKKVDSSDFLKPMLSKAAGKGSLENRVKQKIFSIQRSSGSMDKNFVRRE